MVTKIMPLGASNTYGMYQDPTSPGGYRGPLYDLLTAQGGSFDFVGMDKDGAIGDADHNGYSGKPIDWFSSPANETIYDPHSGQVSTVINTGTLSVVEYFIQQAQMTSTDVILLLVGTNDVRLGDSAETMLKDIQILLDLIVNSAASPLVQLMKLQPIGGDYWRETVNDTTRTNNDTIAIFNAGLEKLVADKYGALGVTLVDSGVTTTKGLSSDGVHLDAAGYQMTAQAWFDSLTSTKQVEMPTSNPVPTEPAPPPSNRIDGTAGDDVLLGTDGNDSLYGYGGNDSLTGGLGHDGLFGGDGHDVLNLDAGNDLLDGGTGLDWVRVNGSVGATIDLAITGAQDTGLGSDTFSGIENAMGASGADTLLGSTMANTLQGAAGNDRLEGRAGDDDLDGGAGNDQVFGGDGNDTLTLDVGDDALDGGAGTDWLRVTGSSAVTIDLANKTTAQVTGAGSDLIRGIENVSGGAGADRISGDSGTNVLLGNGGDDVLLGAAGADTLNGGMGRDTLQGGADRDRDVFVFTAIEESPVGTNRDVIRDFVSGIDLIDLAAIDANVWRTGDDAFKFNGTRAANYSLWYAVEQGGVTLRGDVTGDRVADFEIRLDALSALTANDFIL